MKLNPIGFHQYSKLALLCLLINAPLAQAQDAAATLKTRRLDLQQQLASNQFKRPLYLESSQASNGLKGDIFALIDQPYLVAGPALQDINHWCDILILHLNIKSCRVSTASKNDKILSLNIGRKFDQPLADTRQVNFIYQVVTATPDYLQVEMNAEKGPLGTNHYRIMLEVVEQDAQHSFLHMSYSYAYGLSARVAMQSYLQTIGRDKVGFSIIGHKENGKPIYIGNTRGVVERNTMRYYLAIAAYLGALSTPVPKQLEKRLNDWYTGVERYPTQLHELERSEYLNMKHKEIQRQQAQLQ